MLQILWDKDQHSTSYKFWKANLAVLKWKWRLGGAKPKHKNNLNSSQNLLKHMKFGEVAQNVDLHELILWNSTFLQ